MSHALIHDTKRQRDSEQPSVKNLGRPSAMALVSCIHCDTTQDRSNWDCIRCGTTLTVAETVAGTRVIIQAQ